MESTMKKILSFPLTLLAIAILSACSTAKQNPNLTAAHSSYDNATTNPKVVELAPLELKEAADSLRQADSAVSKGADVVTVSHLSYLAYQQVGIAQETAKRKSAERDVANAAANRDRVQLEARTAEADVASKKVTALQETANSQKAELAAADAFAAEDQATINQQAMQLELLNAKQTKRGMVITLGDVLFASNQSELKSGGSRNVKKLADFLEENPKKLVMIEGYTDSTGDSAHNQALSERRANAVRTALIAAGVNSNRINTRGYGAQFPVAENNTAGSRQMNRRVEIIFSDGNGNIAPR
jgi:outer membrane protein OmpA-like peptidoglycan-associated protein